MHTTILVTHNFKIEKNADSLAIYRYCLDSQNCLLAIGAFGKDRAQFTMPDYNSREILVLSLETALTNLKNGDGRVLAEDIEL